MNLAYKTRVSKQIAAAAVGVCFFVILVTCFMALWNNGTLFPSWVKWHSFALTMDVSGNNQIETAKLNNRHLSITDVEGRQYITPNDWLVADAQFGDITEDETPEVIMLVWRQDADPDEARFRLPLLGPAPGFSQYICVYDFNQGELQEIWTSPPLHFNAREIYVDKAGLLRIGLSNGSVTNWRWREPGLILQDDDIPKSVSPIMK